MVQFFLRPQNYTKKTLKQAVLNGDNLSCRINHIENINNMLGKIEYFELTYFSETFTGQLADELGVVLNVNSVQRTSNLKESAK